MLWTITLILLVLWILGFTTTHALGAWVHLLLVLAIVSVVFNMIRGRRSPG